MELEHVSVLNQPQGLGVWANDEMFGAFNHWTVFNGRSFEKRRGAIEDERLED